MKKYYIGGLLTLVTIAFATVTLAVNKDVIGYRRYIYTPTDKTAMYIAKATNTILPAFVGGVYIYLR